MDLGTLPMENWLEYERIYLPLAEKRATDEIDLSRARKRRLPHSYWEETIPHQEHDGRDLMAQNSGLRNSRKATDKESLGSAVASPPGRARLAEAFGNSEEFDTDLGAFFSLRHKLIATLSPNGVCARAHSNDHLLLDPLDRKMAPTSYTSKVKVRENYQIVGFISSGTYGRVYKAVGRNKPGEVTSPDKEGETIQYTGLSQSAIREISLCSELSHPNLIHLVEIILEEKCIFMVFEYCEHDLLQIIHHHTQPTRHAIPAPMIKSILFQLLNGLLYLHRNWVLHRDLKPANIMVTSNGAVRIGDLGLARLFYKPLTSLFSGDKVVVTIWYRSPDLLLGSKHYTPSVDLWAVGCIFAELLSLRPIFKGEEAKMDSKKTVPFQRNQMIKIIDVLGIPTKEDWPGIVEMPEYPQLQSLAFSRSGGSAYPTPSSTSSNHSRSGSSSNNTSLTGTGLDTWYNNVLRAGNYPNPNPTSTSSTSTPFDPIATPGPLGYDLLSKLLTYDPTQRLTAEEGLEHPYFREQDASGNVNPNGKINVSGNCFEGLTEQYPPRRVSSDDNGIGTGSLPGTKRSGLPDDSLVPTGGLKRRG
jgi:cyclin-dependent kinase 8/11